MNFFNNISNSFHIPPPQEIVNIVNNAVNNSNEIKTIISTVKNSNEITQSLEVFKKTNHIFEVNKNKLNTSINKINKDTYNNLDPIQNGVTNAFSKFGDSLITVSDSFFINNPKAGITQDNTMNYILLGGGVLVALYLFSNQGNKSN